MQRYETLNKLLSGEIIEFEGAHLKMADGELAVGDTYIAERNTGPKFLTVKEIDWKKNLVFPMVGLILKISIRMQDGMSS